MRLQLSNFATGCEPREVNVPGNPLLTYSELRAGDGSRGSGQERLHGRERLADGRTLAEYRIDDGFWIWLEDGTSWTDIEVISIDGTRTQVSV